MILGTLTEEILLGAVFSLKRKDKWCGCGGPDQAAV